MPSRLIRMTGRNPDDSHRSATPLELLFDLAFVVAFGQAASQLSHSIAAQHTAAGVGAFAFAMFAICWAWINFAWFASAYDTDDWFFRVATMVQMIGVIILALGIPALFHSLEEGRHLDAGAIVAGYVIMRVAMVAQWLRAAREDPPRRSTALAYVTFILIAQVGWVVLALLDPPVAVFFALAPVLYLIELGGPVVAERKVGAAVGGTPWHPHHIAERYGLLAIIALGEGVFGTVASVSALVDHQGWSTEAVLVVAAGLGITFGLWWTYFIMPSALVLARHRIRGFVWGYAHILIYAAIAATGAGLHVAAYVIEGETEVGTLGAIVAIAVPVFVFSVTNFALNGFLLREWDSLFVVLFACTVLLLVLAVALAAGGASLGVCLLVVTLSPAVVVVGFETVGHRHQAAMLRRVLA